MYVITYYFGLGYIMKLDSTSSISLYLSPLNTETKLHFTGNLKCSFLNETYLIFIQILFKFILKVPIDNKSGTQHWFR